jgi:hypothetical protein
MNPNLLFIMMVPAIVSTLYFAKKNDWNRYYFHGGILAGLVMAYVCIVTWGWIAR